MDTTLYAEQTSKPASIPAVPDLPQTPETIDKELQAESEGQKFLDKGDMDKALSKFQEAYGLSLEMKYADGQGRALTHMCDLYLMRGQTTKAKELGENAIEVLSSSADKRSLGKARVSLAQAYFALDNPVWAGNQLDEALKSFTQFGLNDAPEAARVMTLAGNVLLKMAKVKEAIQFYQGAAAYYEQAGNHEASIQARVSLSSMMRELGWLVAALEEANKALAEARSLKENQFIPAALAAVAICQYNLGEFANARKSYEELLYLKSPNDLAIARLQAGYGHTLFSTGDLEPARSSLDTALKIIKGKGQVVEQAQIINTIGCIEAAEGNYGKAVQEFNRCLQLIPMVQPKQDRFLIVVLQNLAAVEARAGDYRASRAHLLEILPLFKKFKDRSLIGRTYACLGEVALSMQDLLPAQEYLKQGIAISEKINDDSALWRDYTNLADILLKQGQVKEAKDALTSALSYCRSPQAGWFAYPERLVFTTSREDLGQRLVSLLVSQGQYEQALLAAEQLKEESFINEWLRRGGEVKPYDRDIYNDLTLQRAHLHAAEVSSTPDVMTKEWQSWLGRFKQLANSNRALTRLIAPVPTSGSEIVKGVTKNHAVAIDYLIGSRTTIAFTIDSSGKLSAAELPVGRSQLARQVATLLAASNKGELDSARNERSNLQLLFSELFSSEVRAVLPQNPDQTVVILPDGVLFDLPFAALIDQNGQYMVQNHTLTVASSLGVYLDSPPPYSKNVSVMVASGDAGNQNNQAANASEESQISSIFQPDLVTKLTGKEADLNNLEAEAKECSILHFVSKLNLYDNNPLACELPILSSKEDGKYKASASRLFGLTLPSDLVVWSSACVNYKDAKGTALNLFSRGLSYAGVRNVLMSLWVEPDLERTAQLMEFYRGGQVGLNPAQSLRKAQLLALAKDPSPRTWAAFQLLGPGI